MTADDDYEIYQDMIEEDLYDYDDQGRMPVAGKKRKGYRKSSPRGKYNVKRKI